MGPKKHGIFQLMIGEEKFIITREQEETSR